MRKGSFLTNLVGGMAGGAAVLIGGGVLDHMYGQQQYDSYLQATHAEVTCSGKNASVGFHGYKITKQQIEESPERPLFISPIKDGQCRVGTTAG